MALLRVQLAETYNKEKFLAEAGFFQFKPCKCLCDSVPYEHTHDSNYFLWGTFVDNEYYTFDEEDK